MKTNFGLRHLLSFSHPSLPGLRILGLVATFALLSACSADTNPGTDTTKPDQSGGDDDDDNTGSGDNTTPTSTTTTSNTDQTNGMLKANGEVCVEATECMGGFCTELRQGEKICGECDADKACQDGSKGLNCIYDREAEKPHLRCSTGELGESCDADAGCKDGKCHLTETDQGNYGVCGECRNDKECQDAGTGLACTSKEKDGKTYPQCSAGELGEACESNESCKSGICADTGAFTGQRCSECGTDKECADAEKGINCTLGGEQPAVYLKCSTGELSESCDGNEGCKDGKCAKVGEESVCSSCTQDSDCKDTEACSLKSNENDSFERTCIELGSVKDNGTCLATGTKEVCEHHCVVIDASFNPDFGICGACRPDKAAEDCKADEKCTPPTVKFENMEITIVGSICEKK